MKIVKGFEMETILETIKNSSPESSIYVGCDAQVKGSQTDFVTVVIIHFGSRHGAKIFYEKNREERRLSMREKLWKEVELVSILALSLIDSIGERSFSVHLDLNPDKRYKSNVIIQEAVGYIRGLGLDVKTKPDAFAASHCADHFVKR